MLRHKHPAGRPAGVAAQNAKDVQIPAQEVRFDRKAAHMSLGSGIPKCLGRHRRVPPATADIDKRWARETIRSE
jgi:hypothetical protein